MALVGVFIIQSLEETNLSIVSARLDDVYDSVVSEFQEYRIEQIRSSSGAVEEILSRHVDIGFREEIYIIDALQLEIVASSTAIKGVQDISSLDAHLMVEAIAGEVKEDDFVLGNKLKVKDKAYPIKKGDQIIGVLYLRYDLSDIYQMINRSRIIILQAVVTALLVTVVVSYIVSKSITDPINEVTKKARMLAKGDFDQVIEVRSDDEIGAFSETFNYLSGELKRSVNQITDEKMKLETIINHMKDGLVAVDLDGKIIQKNKMADEWLGAMDGNAMVALSQEDHTGIEKNTFIRYINERSLKFIYAPFVTEGAKKLGVVFVIQDITEEHRLENMRRDFVANVSHELKTPLTSIISYAETLHDGGIEDESISRQFTETIISEAERMSRIVTDLLELSNYDSQRAVMKKDWVNIVDLVGDTIRSLALVAQKNQQHIIYQSIPDFNAYVDPDKIRQLLINTISNALKYSSSGSDVEVTLAFVEEQECLHVTVTDHGMGIPKADLEHIFDRFYRVDKARSRQMGGTGLGLSIAKEIVMAHGGEITVNSVVEEGTSIGITLPVFVKNS